ncbi:MAG: PEP-CTERM sorting domain-containing protein [Gemmatimonadaceae bacterium]|nr:PEP-CTERM sorting domain-containing protein [Gemmatimonadaceae bacterium]
MNVVPVNDRRRAAPAALGQLRYVDRNVNAGGSLVISSPVTGDLAALLDATWTAPVTLDAIFRADFAPAASDPSIVPEPATSTLLGTGLLVLATLATRRRRTPR